MLVRSLKFSGFRNLVPGSLEPGPRFNVFAGKNGQGKTNLLEAIYSVCTLRSFRTSRLRDLIAIAEPSGYVRAQVERSGLERRYELTIHERSRIVRLDGKAVRPIARYFGDFNVVLFAPEDLLVARASPGERRRFLDRAVFTMRPDFLSCAQDFEKVLKSRNLILRDDAMNRASKTAMLEVYDQQLAGLAAQILRARLAYLDAIEPGFVRAFDAIGRSGLPVAVRYQPSADLGDRAPDQLEAAMHEALLRSRPADLARGVTLVGPHRDVLEFRLAEQPAGSFASQGQLRAMILAWKTAEMELLAKEHQDPPVLLLDDVSSELDPERNAYLFEFLKSRPGQCFITTTHPRFVLLDSDRRDFQVENGAIESVQPP